MHKEWWLQVRRRRVDAGPALVQGLQPVQAGIVLLAQRCGRVGGTVLVNLVLPEFVEALLTDLQIAIGMVLTESASVAGSGIEL